MLGGRRFRVFMFLLSFTTAMTSPLSNDEALFTVRLAQWLVYLLYDPTDAGSNPGAVLVYGDVCNPRIWCTPGGNKADVFPSSVRQIKGIQTYP